jgi:hypothetical protein
MINHFQIYLHISYQYWIIHINIIEKDICMTKYLIILVDLSLSPSFPWVDHFHQIMLRP